MDTKSPQGKYLMERISNHVGRHSANYGSRRYQKQRSSEPPNVRAARKLISTYEKTLETQQETHNAKVERAAGNAREAVLFYDEDHALMAVKKFEAMTF